MKIYAAGLSGTGQFEVVSKRAGVKNLLFSFAEQGQRKMAMRWHDTCCPSCGQELVRVGEHLVCPDKLNELRRKIGEIK